MFRTTPDEFGDLHETDEVTSSAPDPTPWSGFADAQPVLRESGLPRAVERIFTTLDSMSHQLHALRSGLDAIDRPRR